MGILKWFGLESETIKVLREFANWEPTPGVIDISPGAWAFQEGMTTREYARHVAKKRLEQKLRPGI